MTPAESRAERKRFNRLLSALDRNRNRAGEAYESLRQRLLTLFSCNDFPDAHDLVDETLRRLECKLEQGEQIENMTGYAAGIARYVCLEAEKDRRKIEDVEDPGDIPNPDIDPDEQAERERRSECLARCLKTLSERERRLILDFYDYPENKKAAPEEKKASSRRRLAGSLGISGGNLRIKAHRLRKSIEACVRDCVQRRSG